VQLFRDLESVPGDLCGGAVSIGNFDGVHRGHARIVERLKAVAVRFEARVVLRSIPSRFAF